MCGILKFSFFCNAKVWRRGKALISFEKRPHHQNERMLGLSCKIYIGQDNEFNLKHLRSIGISIMIVPGRSYYRRHSQRSQVEYTQFTATAKLPTAEHQPVCDMAEAWCLI